MEHRQQTVPLNIQGDQFHLGLWTSRAADELPLGAATVCKNVDFSRSKGRICKRRGLAVDHASNGAGSCTGFYQFILSSGTKFDLLTSASTVWSVSGSTYTVRFSGSMAGADVNFTQLSDLAIMVASTESTSKWDGVAASFSVLLGTPPANGKYICIWQNRVWIANTSAGKSRLHYSNVGLPEDWTTAGAAGFIDININDGDQITGIMPVGPALYVFKNRTVYKIMGVTPTTFSVQPIIGNRGCISPRSIVNMGPFVVYLSQYGIHSVGDGGIDGFMNEAIEGDIIDIPKTKVCGGKLRDLFVLCYDSDGDGQNDTAFALDARLGAWQTWDNFKANVMVTKDDGSLYSAGSDLVITRKHDTGEDDSGTPITMQWRSGMLGWEDFTAIKRLLDQWFKGKPIAGKNLIVKIYVDGVLQSTDSTPLDPAFTGETVKVFGQGAKALNMEGRFFQIEFVNAELAAPVEITGLSLAATVMPRQQASA